MNNFRILFDLQLKHSAKLLRGGNPKGLIYPFWSFAQSMQALRIRSTYKKLKSDQAKPIWLYSERINAAGDNAEAFFEYCVKARPDIEHIFIINNDSPDAERLQKLGRTVEVKSYDHKLLFLLAEKCFLSHPEVCFLNPFGSKENCYKDLPRPDLVFLQHGITQNDLSAWLNKEAMGFSLIVTAAQKEYDSFLDAPYGYTKENLIKCGMPRFDKLKNSPKNKVIIMPTWRQNLAGAENPRNNLRDYNPKFKKSEYYKFYNDLINDDRVIEAMQDHGVSGEFYLHSSHEAQVDDFAGNSVFKIMRPPYDYNKAFAEGNLLVTDYSSVAFDFAYLEKPVLYCPFDRDSIYGGNHISTKNYISAERDGFGPVVTDYESTVTEIIKFIKNNFKMTPIYQKRAREFYFYHDHKNCERLLRAIEKFDRNRL